MAALGEFGLIAEVSAVLGAAPVNAEDPAGSATPDCPETPAGARSPHPLVGIGDDAAVLAAPDGRVVASTDFLLEGRHFRRDWSTAADVGVKAAARSLIDVAAMGAVPTGLLVALAAPGDLPVSWARDLTRGLATECARAGASIIGGDTARAPSVLLTTTVLGDLEGRAPVLRSGARPGDVVAVAGPLGRAAAGLALLAAGLDGAAWAAPLLDAQRRPQPPYDAGPEAAGLGATAMIDVSDGLLADLGHVAAASGVLIDVSAGRLAPEEVLLTAARAVAAARRHDDPGRTGHAAPAASPDSLAADALSWVLAGGEDHALIATFPPGTALPARWTVIGAVREGLGPHGAPGVTVDGRPWAGSAGWDHFAASG